MKRLELRVISVNGETVFVLRGRLKIIGPNISVAQVSTYDDSNYDDSDYQ